MVLGQERSSNGTDLSHLGVSVGGYQWTVAGGLLCGQLGAMQPEEGAMHPNPEACWVLPTSFIHQPQLGARWQKCGT